MHSVTVSPNAVNVAIAGKVVLAASVDADAGVTDRTVTWTSSDATVASVGTDGTVTGVKAGTVTITAASKAAPDVKGAAAVTVAAANPAPTVTIASINNTICGVGGCNSVPANTAAAVGQLDIILNVEANGQTLKSVQATLKCGNDSLTQAQTISDLAPISAEAAAAPVTLSFNTAAFNAAGVPTLHNGACSITATATTAAGVQSATNSTTLTLANIDGVLVTETFAQYSNAEGINTATTATDAGGLTWRGGAVTLTAVPVLYSGRTVATLSLTLPGAAGQTQTISAAPFTATWSATSTNGSNVTGKTLYDAVNLEANNSTPKGITPAVIALDTQGNDLALGIFNPGAATFRLDNTPPQAPTSFVIAGRQAGWTNPAYTFGGTGGASFSPATGTTKYVSCGDGVGNAPVAGYACAAALLAPGVVITVGNPGQIGVSAGAVSGTTGINLLTSFSWYAIPAASYTPASALNGTSTSATACSTAGWTKITTAGDLAATLSNTAYVVRAFEADKLGNARCTDLAAGANTINTNGAFAKGTFGQDKLPPTAAYIEPAADVTAAPNNGTLNVAANIGNFNIKMGLSDDASGFSSTPVSTMVQRLAVPAGGTAAASFNSAFGCPSGLNNGTCVATSTPQNVRGDANGITQADGTTIYAATQDVSTTPCVGCGYYFFTQTPLDLARNAAPVMNRQVVIDYTAPTVGGIAVPATITGGASASFATSASDNLDLISTDYTLTYASTPVGGIGSLPIRATGPVLGVAFDNVLTTASSFSLNIPFFIRNIAWTVGGNAPANNGAGGLPNNIALRAYDAAANASPPGVAAIAPANVPQTGRTDFTVAPAGANPLAVMSTFQEANVVANVSNCPAAGCAGGVAPANATSVTLTATSTGVEGATFQFINPFTQVQFYFLDPANNEYTLIGSAVAPVVTDNATVTIRTFTWTLTTAFDPPVSAGFGTTLKVIAIGVNALGDGLASAVNTNLTLTNP
ncbi:MAG TPA: Ig-like domain-containing protein [Gemmatimonadaceae bacterium]|nr:Ig-like domain-containing protein [Gemmatimonadaceae bacterium]